MPDSVGALRVVCLGDSITGPRPREAYHAHFLKFSDLLQLMLEARLGIGRAVGLNRGFSGQTSADGLSRLQEDVIAEQPHIAIVLLGGNDRGAPQLEAAQTRHNLYAILSGVKNTDIKALALQYHVLSGGDDATTWHWLDDNNPIIAEVANSLAIPTLDMGAAMREAATIVPRAELVNVVDGVHLNPGGELVYARAIFAKLDQLGWICMPKTLPSSS